ncbi:MAG TPA: hypothetical protein ENK18_01995 [Deltaproteobacteria bacterium]|nr:hypothetical protein [Deltaproteobacteria bacterium]
MWGTWLGSLIGGGCAAPVAQPTWRGEIEPLIEARCAGCHSEGNLAPLSLDSYEAVVEALDPVVYAIESRSMPPWGAAPIRSYRYDPSLTDDQIAAVVAWAEAGAPRGSGEVAAEAPAAVEQPSLDRIDVSIGMSDPYTPNGSEHNGDDYRCFSFPWPSGERYITGFEAVPGNLASAHHVAAYIVPPFQAEIVAAFEASHPEVAGYPCYGTAAMDGWEPASALDELQQGLVGVWAPGVGAVRTPRGTGLEVEPGSTLVVQMHYYTLATDDPTDQTAVHFQTATEVDQVGYSVFWLDLTWALSPTSMQIPAGAEGVGYAYRAPLQELPGLSLLAPDLDLTAPVRIHSVMPHQHLLGRSIELTAHHLDGGAEPVVEIPDYDFSWQRFYEPTEAVVMAPGDELEVSCVWDNTAASRAEAGAVPIEPVDVTWGEGTTDEMCIAVLYATN